MLHEREPQKTTKIQEEALVQTFRDRHRVYWEEVLDNVLDSFDKGKNTVACDALGPLLVTPDEMGLLDMPDLFEVYGGFHAWADAIARHEKYSYMQNLRIATVADGEQTFKIVIGDKIQPQNPSS